MNGFDVMFFTGQGARPTPSPQISNATRMWPETRIILCVIAKSLSQSDSLWSFLPKCSLMYVFLNASPGGSESCAPVD
jgi:hypothetical protein